MLIQIQLENMLTDFINTSSEEQINAYVDNLISYLNSGGENMTAANGISYKTADVIAVVNKMAADKFCNQHN